MWFPKIGGVYYIPKSTNLGSFLGRGGGGKGKEEEGWERDETGVPLHSYPRRGLTGIKINRWARIGVILF